MLNRRSIMKSLCALPFLGFLKAAKDSMEVTDTEIVDCFVYVSNQLESVKLSKNPWPELTLYMSSRFWRGVEKRYCASGAFPKVMASSIGPVEVEINDNVNWGNGPEYTCWLTNLNDNERSQT